MKLHITKSLALRSQPTAGLPAVLALLLAGLFVAAPLPAQVPVDEAGNPLEVQDVTERDLDASSADVADEELLEPRELEELVGPVALYPDKLLAVVLPASTYPLEIVQAARFLDELEQDSSLEPDESWDDSVTALLNYPEVLRMMNDDLDWTWRLGEAFVQQQEDVIAAVETFRDRAYAAGNLKSDDRQTVRQRGGALEIEPVSEEIIYVPFYEPAEVVHYQPRQVYYYYPRPYPVYYYPYPQHYAFSSGYFWGLTSAFRIGWTSRHLHVFHHSYWGHPYYGRHYWGHYYRRPSISVHNRFYVNRPHYRTEHHHRDGDLWRPRREGGARPGHYAERQRARTAAGYSARNSGLDRDARRAARTDSAGFSSSRNRSTEGSAGGASRPGFAPSRESSVRTRAGTGARANIEERRRQVQDQSRRESSARTDGQDTAIRFRPRADSESAAGRTRSADTATRVRDQARGPRQTERRETGDSVRFRAREPSSTPQAPAATTRMAAPRTTAPTPRATAPTPRATAPTPRATAPTPRATAPTPRATAPTPRATAPAPRATAPAPRATAPASRATAPRAAPAPATRSAAPRASAPQPSARPSPPARSSSSPPPRQSAPARESRAPSAASGRSSSGRASGVRGTRSRDQ